MSQSVSSVSPVEIGLASGFLGCGIGYTLAPRRYSLNRLLSEKPDVFEKAVIKKFLAKGSENQKNAYRKILNARNSLKNGKKNLQELVKSQKLNSAYKEIKSFIPKARGESAFVVGSLAAVSGIITKVLFKTKN